MHPEDSVCTVHVNLLEVFFSKDGQIPESIAEELSNLSLSENGLLFLRNPSISAPADLMTKHTRNEEELHRPVEDTHSIRSFSNIEQHS
jgi:hypothetical protein